MTEPCFDRWLELQEDRAMFEPENDSEVTDDDDDSQSTEDD